LYACCYAKQHGLQFDLYLHDLHTQLSQDEQAQLGDQMISDLMWLGFRFDHTYRLSERKDLLDSVWNAAAQTYPVVAHEEYHPACHYIDCDWLVQDLVNRPPSQRHDEIAALAYANLNDFATGITTQVLGRDVASMVTHFTALSYLLYGTPWHSPLPGFVFVELVQDPDGRKISKSCPAHACYSIEHLRDQGVDPAYLLTALYNSGMRACYRMGPDAFSLEELASQFDVTHLIHRPVSFDVQNFLRGGSGVLIRNLD